MIIIVIRWGRIFIQMHRQTKTKKITRKDNNELVVMQEMKNERKECIKKIIIFFIYITIIGAFVYYIMMLE